LTNKISCSHCHLKFDEMVMIKDDEYFFCCKGCQGVYHLLNEEGLDSFYEKSGNITLTPPAKNLEDSSSFNSRRNTLFCMHMVK